MKKDNLLYFIIGVLLMLSIFLFIGASPSGGSEVGRYQIASIGSRSSVMRVDTNNRFY